MVVRRHQESDIRFNAAQLLFDNYELDETETIDVVINLDSDALGMLYGREIAEFVGNEMYWNTSDYDVCQSLDELSKGYIDSRGMYLKEASVDTRSYFDSAESEVDPDVVL